MIGVVLAYIFYSEVIYYEGKQDRSPFVAPHTRGFGELVVVVFYKVCLQDAVGEAARLRETIDTVADFEIHPAFVDIVVEFLLVNELLGDVGELGFYVFGMVKWCC